MREEEEKKKKKAEDAAIKRMNKKRRGAAEATSTIAQQQKDPNKETAEERRQRKEYIFHTAKAVKLWQEKRAQHAEELSRAADSIKHDLSHIIQQNNVQIALLSSLIYNSNQQK